MLHRAQELQYSVDTVLLSLSRCLQVQAMQLLANLIHATGRKTLETALMTESNYTTKKIFLQQCQNNTERRRRLFSKCSFFSTVLKTATERLKHLLIIASLCICRK